MSDRRERLDNPEEATLTAMEGLQAKIWTALPGIVVSVDLAAQTLSVQPAIQGVTSGKDNDETNVNLPVLIHVPIVWPRAGGYALTFPIKAGDEVLVVFSSRAIDSWWQSGGIGTQIEARMHDLSDGFAILAPTSQAKKLANVSSTSVQMRNEAGTAYIEITDDGDINMVSPRDVKLTAARNNMQTATALTTIASTGLMSLSSAAGLNLGATGGSAVTINSGPITWNYTGLLALNGPSLTHNAKNIGATHTHTGVTTGGGTSGAPT